ncbi:hypothetical protein, partial [Kitasatospora sp. NPDC093558]|uniref:hypothetical protein n=1 Tax=Kitasatospora sp. NPDC093558 TaxID=3155201 RepID=UPI00343F053B
SGAADINKHYTSGPNYLLAPSAGADTLAPCRRPVQPPRQGSGRPAGRDRKYARTRPNVTVAAVTPAPRGSSR